MQQFAPAQFMVNYIQLTIKAGLVSLGIIITLTRLVPLQATPVLSVNGVGADSYPGGQTVYRLELLNHTDQIVYDGVLTATLPAGFSYVPGSTIVMGEGWPMESREPAITGQTLTWGPYHLPAAGIKVHNPYGIHTLMESCDGIPALHLEGAKMLTGNGGYVTQLFYPIDLATTGPSQCAINFVQEAYARNLIPILRLQGHRLNGVWQAPSPGPGGNYTEIAQAYARYVAGLPRRDTNPLYIVVWNEPDLWIEWSGRPNATQYARFFVAVSNAIRQLGDARIRVVNGALTPGNPAFINQMLQVPGFRDAFDVWASHCYPYNHPAWYNYHNGTARYGTYSIDCYFEETAIINRYGRAGVKVMLTETGYALGNNTFGFEGFPAITESNRAGYIASAFKDYWLKWPEIVAVTPFELTDASGLWAAFDWVHPYPPYPPHPQYTTVASLPKPAGQLQPYGYQVIFKAQISTNTLTGTYTLSLSGSERDGNFVSAGGAAPVTVQTAPPRQSIYLPVMLKSPGNQGPWYQLAPPEAAVLPAASAGAIVPGNFLTASMAVLAAHNQFQVTDVLLSGPPLAAAPVNNQMVAVLLADGRVELIDTVAHQTVTAIFAGSDPQTIIAAPQHLYTSLGDGLAQIDPQSGQILNRRAQTGLLRGLAWDSAGQRLFVAAAGQEQLLIFNADLSQQLAAIPLGQQPNHLLFDDITRRLYISFPANSQIAALNGDTLQVVSQARLIGGPILKLALDAPGGKLYALSALAPKHRGITAWQAGTLTQTALVAGTTQFPFHTAQALAVDPNGNLLVAEVEGVWQITPDSWAVSHIDTTVRAIPATELLVSQTTIYLLEPQQNLLRIYQ